MISFLPTNKWETCTEFLYGKYHLMRKKNIFFRLLLSTYFFLFPISSLMISLHFFIQNFKTISFFLFFLEINSRFKTHNCICFYLFIYFSFPFLPNPCYSHFSPLIPLTSPQKFYQNSLGMVSQYLPFEKGTHFI